MIQKKAFYVKSFLLALILVSLGSCSEMWGSLDDPADPKSDNYQGYETIDDPDAIAPVETNFGIVAYVPKLVATKVDGATAYQFRVSATSNPGMYLYESAEVAGNEYLPVDCYGLSATTTYYWFVRVKVGGAWGAWSTETATFSLSVITGISPISGSTTSDTTPLLDWDDASDAISFHVQIASTEGGLTFVPELPATSSEHQTSEILAVGDTRWWRVCAVNASSQHGAWTAVSSFTIVPPPPSPPLLLTPADDSSSTSVRPEFTWTAVDGAASYEIAIVLNVADLASVTPEVASSPSWIPASDLSKGLWYWGVRCVDTYGAKGEWSGAWSIERPYSIGDIGPAGGKVFYDKGSFSTGWRYLEAAPSDQSTGIQWYNGIYMTIGATLTGIGSGETNTANIVSFQGYGAYAASLCANLNLAGYDDWFLPSKDELNLLYGQKGVVGGFSPLYYWSSTEGGSNTAWSQYFDSSYLGHNLLRNSNERVRAIRAF